jgi:hypothetical protein
VKLDVVTIAQRDEKRITSLSVLFLTQEKYQKKHGCKYFAINSVPFHCSGNNSRCSNSFPHCHSIPLNLFDAKYLMPLNMIQILTGCGKYETNKEWWEFLFQIEADHIKKFLFGKGFG